jgi:hypothetical protein
MDVLDIDNGGCFALLEPNSSCCGRIPGGQSDGISILSDSAMALLVAGCSTAYTSGLEFLIG